METRPLFQQQQDLDLTWPTFAQVKHEHPAGLILPEKEAAVSKSGLLLLLVSRISAFKAAYNIAAEIFLHLEPA